MSLKIAFLKMLSCVLGANELIHSYSHEQDIGNSEKCDECMMTSWKGSSFCITVSVTGWFSPQKARNVEWWWLPVVYVGLGHHDALEASL